MKNLILKINEIENSIKGINQENSFSIIWFIVAIFWSAIAPYVYNEFLTNKSVVTKIMFLVLALLLIWKNKAIIKPFFESPFKSVGKPYSFSNVIWIYPFIVLLSTVLFVLIPQIFGGVSTDPQNIEQMSISINEYITKVILLPLLVFEEESLNVLIVITISKFLSKRMKRGWFYIAILLTSCFFGFLHVTAWGWESAISRMFIHIPFIFSILYFRTAWISMLAHFYQNALTYTNIIYPNFSALFVGCGILICFLIIIYRYFLKKLK